MNHKRAVFGAIVGAAVLIVVVAWAVRNLTLFPADPVTVSVLYSTEKEGWLTEVAQKFEASNPQVNGHPIKLEMKEMGSREIYLAVLDGTEKPDLISPASMLQISILQDLSTGKYGKSLVNPSDTATCRPVVSTPLVLVAWKERADVLWGNQPGADLWHELHDVTTDPLGWKSRGHPEWGYVKFGHTNPLKSNSGLMTILLMTYSYFNKTDGLTSNDILSNADYQKWFLETEGTISQFGESTGTYMKDMVAYGPSVYDLVAVYESAAIEQADNAKGRYGELRVYYPPTTVMSDHPFCVLNADWVTPDQAQASKVFMDYLSGHEAQELALLKYGFRPTDNSVALDQADSPFTRYAADGISIQLPPLVKAPSGDTLNTLLDFWSRNIHK
jgi:ABC-type sulfate transport system substrate-binding protein